MLESAYAETLDKSLVNLSAGKRCSQSSHSKWSAGASVQEDAAHAVNGNLTSDVIFHTDREYMPWWQVDLAAVSCIDLVRIYNRNHCAFRLRYFSILVSLNGVDWLTVYRKREPSVFGEADSEPFEVALTGVIGRYLRIRLDGSDFLHFRECQVFGHEPDPQSRGEQIANFNKKIASHEGKRLSIHWGRSGQQQIVSGFSLFVDSQYDPAIQSALVKGSYEGREVTTVRACLKPADRVIEIGSAIGLVSMTIAHIVGEQNLCAYDGNPEIVDHANRNFQWNGFDQLKARNGILLNRVGYARSDSKHIRFGISKQFWASRILGSKEPQEDISKVIDVPALCLEDEIARTKATAIVCDIEGGEADLFAEADLTGISLMILETHYWSAGKPAIDAMVRRLVGTGFNINLDRTANHVVVFERGR